MIALADNPNHRRPARLEQLIGRLRRHQLELAIRGRVRESARYADRAQRVRRAATDSPSL